MPREVKNLKEEINKELEKEPGEISIIKLVDLIVEYGYSARASDIHIQPQKDEVVVRFRVDGILHDVFEFPRELQSEVISRIKVLSGLKTDIHQVPQDGRFKVNVEEGEQADIRVSIAPTYYGENAVMRILADTAKQFDLEELGFSEKQLKKVEDAISKPYGMILSNGPTGSGKTTSLYTLLRKLNEREVSIITIEDPIEYSLKGVTQMPVNPEAGLTFANGLRSMLRQDPDIIMVGEIRDQETANIAVNAALTGHLMFSTLHTNDAATTFPRLMDMGVPPFLVASTLNVAIAQRLVREVCSNCSETREIKPDELQNLDEVEKDFVPDEVYTAGEGCDECDGMSYVGRVGVFEVLEVNDKIRSLILEEADASEIKRAAVDQGMTPMVGDGLQKVKEGITTIEEVLRIIYE